MSNSTKLAIVCAVIGVIGFLGQTPRVPHAGPGSPAIERNLEEAASSAESADVECAGGSQYHCAKAASIRLTASFKLGMNHNDLDPETYNRLNARLSRRTP